MDSQRNRNDIKRTFQIEATLYPRKSKNEGMSQVAKDGSIREGLKTENKFLRVDDSETGCNKYSGVVTWGKASGELSDA